MGSLVASDPLKQSVVDTGHPAMQGVAGLVTICNKSSLDALLPCCLLFGSLPSVG